MPAVRAQRHQAWPVSAYHLLPISYLLIPLSHLFNLVHNVHEFPPDGIPGLVMVIHTLGDYARFHSRASASTVQDLYGAYQESLGG